MQPMNSCISTKTRNPLELVRFKALSDASASTKQKS